MTLPIEISSGLKDLLRGVIQERGNIDLARVQVVNLSELDGQPGRSVERYKEVAKSHIQQHLTKDDLLIPYAGGYLVLYGRVSGHAADVASAALTRSLTERFYGEKGLQGLSAQASHLVMTAEEVMREISLQLPEPVNEPAPAPRGGARGSLPKITPPKLSARDSEAPAAFFPTSPRAAQAMRPIEVVTAEDFSSFSIRFQPVWDLKKGLLHTYWAVPEGDVPLIGADYMNLPKSKRQTLHRYELMTIDDALDAFSDAISEGRKWVLGVTFSFQSLADVTTRIELYQRLNKISVPYRRYVAVRIDGVVAGAPMNYLTEWVLSIKGIGFQVVVSFSWDNPAWREIAACGPDTLSIPWPRRGLQARKEDVIARLKSLVEAGAMMRARVCVEDVRAREEVAVCFAAKVDYLAGEVLPLETLPRGVVTLTPSDMAARLR
ncbi:MAG: hypothetical protein HXY22_01290 [Alphaproteobacteria bacterium]|nr:hypothetical protein [Alphaproteobacteria bacterium]